MKKFTYDYPRPAATVDLAVFVLEGATFRMLMIRRKAEPFAGRWALPGGFVNIDEPFEAAARRELKEETGLDATGPVEFIGVFGAPGRDPRGRTISIAHAAVVRGPAPKVEGGDDAAEAAWLTLDEAKGLAFDHDEIVAAARRWLRHAVLDGPAGVTLLPARFTEAHVADLIRAALGSEPGAATSADVLNARAWIEGRLEDGFIRKARKAGAFDARKIPVVPSSYGFPFAHAWD